MFSNSSRHPRLSQGSRSLMFSSQQVGHLVPRLTTQPPRPNEAATRGLVAAKQLTSFDDYTGDDCITHGSRHTGSKQAVLPTECLVASPTEDKATPDLLQKIDYIASLHRSFKLFSSRCSAASPEPQTGTLQQLQVVAMGDQMSGINNENNRNTEPKLTRVYMACAEDKGTRKYMEDRSAVCSSTYSNSLIDEYAGGVVLDNSTAYAGVFDGHGGHQTAAHLARKLHPQIFKKLHQAALSPTTSRSSMSSSCSWPSSQSPAGSQCVSGTAAPGHCASVKDVIKTTFINFDHNWRDETAGLPFDNSGSTAVIALVNRENLVIANAGDSVAVLARAGSAVRLSHMHHAEDELEAERVMAAGGVFVKGKGGGYRVMQNPTTLPAGERYAAQPHVANTRAFGDFKLKRHHHPILTAEPYVAEVELTLENTLLLLASDGVSDVLSDQEMVDVALDAVEQACYNAASDQDLADAAASAVKSTALAKGAWDNVTAAVMLFEWQQM